MLTEEELRSKIIEQLQTVHDPEIPVNIWDLGLIYEIQILPPLHNIFVQMTVTAPNCPVADTLPLEVQAAIEQIEGIGEVHVEMTFDPPWSKDFMSEVAKVELDMF